MIFNKKFKSIIMQFAAYSCINYEWIYCNSNYIFAWGKKYRKIILNHLMDKNIKIIETGTPLFSQSYR